MTKTQADIDRGASALKEDGLPDGFNRLLLMTPEQFNAIKEAAMTSKIGPRAQALRDQREALAKENARPARKPAERPAPAPAVRQPAPEAPAPEKPKETAMSTQTIEIPKAAGKGGVKAKTPAKASAASVARKTTASAKAAPKGKAPAPEKNAPAGSSARIQLRDGEKKMDLVERLLKSAQGATRKQLSEATGWPYVNLKGAEKRAGDSFELKADGDRFRLVAKAAA